LRNGFVTPGMVKVTPVTMAALRKSLRFMGSTLK
jgi:hypothetical protein